MSVMAQTVAASFKPFIDLGLPLSQARNGNVLVARPLSIDPEIEAVHAFNPSGIIVHSTLDPKPQSVPREVLLAMRLSGDVKWSVETSDHVIGGFNVRRRDAVVGAVAAAYPKERLDAASRGMRTGTFQAAFLVWLAFSALAFVLLRFLLAAPVRAVATLKALSGVTDQEPSKPPPQSAANSGLFGPAIEQLTTNLAAATRRFEEVERALKAFVRSTDAERGAAKGADDTVPRPPEESMVASTTTRSLAGQLAGRLAPVSAVFIAVSALILGGLILSSVNESIVPELAGRTNLIGTVVSENVERAVGAGVPLDELVGAEDYFGDMLEQLPEVAYIAVATGRIVLEAGERTDPYLAPPRERKGVRSHPIRQMSSGFVRLSYGAAVCSRRGGSTGRAASKRPDGLCLAARIRHDLSVGIQPTCRKPLRHGWCLYR